MPTVVVTAFALCVYSAHGLAKGILPSNSILHSKNVSLIEDDVLAARQQNGSIVPSDARFVILLRGETFRYDKQGVGRVFCDSNGKESQTRITTSLLTNVIEPLESQRNSIDIVFTSRVCKLNEEIVGILGHRVKAWKVFAGPGQSINLRHALETLNDLYGGIDGVASSFDYVLVQRNDLQWIATVHDWTAKWTNFNFLAHCGRTAVSGNAKWSGGEKCVWDTLHVMPGRMYPAFNDAVGTISDGYKCFREKNDQSGHACYYAISAALKKRQLSTDFGYLADRYVPVRGATIFESEFCALPLPAGP